MKITVDIIDKIPKKYHDELIKRCLREFCNYDKPIIGTVVGTNRIIENIKYEFSMRFDKGNSLVFFVCLTWEGYLECI